jgi:hypothetical protein
MGEGRVSDIEWGTQRFKEITQSDAEGETAMFIQEKAYRVYFNEKGELLFVILEKDGEANKPMIIYDGGPHAILYRNREQTVLLDYLNEQVREPLTKIKQALVAEFKQDGETLVREYDVPVKQMKQLPLPSEGIITPEEAAKEIEKFMESQNKKLKPEL